MNSFRRLLTVTCALLLALVLAVGPVHATEGGGEGGEGGVEKIELPERPRDQLALLLVGFLILGGVFALDNARRQLKGERDQASGEFRWR